MPYHLANPQRGHALPVSAVALALIGHDFYFHVLLHARMHFLNLPRAKAAFPLLEHFRSSRRRQVISYLGYSGSDPALGANLYNDWTV